MVSDKQPAPSVRWRHVTALLEKRGHITVGYVTPIEGAAIAADEHTLFATVVRRPDEPFDELLQRLDDAIGSALNGGATTNEIEGGHFVLATPVVKK